jgi:5-methylcytosine-specific restriction endonuclease McrA
MFIQQKCPRCGSNLRKSSNGVVNCFFCEGYSFREIHDGCSPVHDYPLSAFAFQDQTIDDFVPDLLDTYPCSRLPVDEISKMDFDEILQGTPWRWQYGTWKEISDYWRMRKHWMARRPWRAIRKVVLDENDRECFDCEENKKLRVHHIHPVFRCLDEEYEIDNLVPLCIECHNKRHSTQNNIEDSEP